MNHKQPWTRAQILARGNIKAFDVATPTTPAEFEEFLNDRSKLADSLKSNTFANVVQNYVKAVAEKDQSIADQVKEQCEATLADMLKTNKTEAKRLNLNPMDNGPARYAAIQNDRAIGAPLNGVFNDMAEFMQATWHKNASTSNKDVQAKLQTLRDYQEKVPSEGGYLVPEEFRAELLRLSLESSVVRPRARVVPMSSATLRFPAIDSTTNVGSVFGGITVYRTEEGADLIESQATFEQIKLEVTKQTALATVTNELVRDAAGGFAMYVEQMFPEAIAFFEDVDFMKGTGVGEPLGSLTNHPAMIAVAKETSQPGATILWENVLKMYARMLPSSLQRAVWVVTPDAFVQLATMALNVGVGGSAVWLTDAHGAPQLTLLGRPVIMSEKAPGVLGAQGDISFVDFGLYLIGDRQQMTIDSSEHVKFGSDKTQFRVIQRNDGRPWLQSPITPQNGGPTMSGFVQVAVRS